MKNQNEKNTKQIKFHKALNIGESWPEKYAKKRSLRSRLGFTLPEILIAVSIFAVATTIVAGLYVQSFRETKRANLQNQVYGDARYVLSRIADEVRDGMVDYDEYYNQNVILEAFSEPKYGDPSGGVGSFGVSNYGQNYGRYYSSFYNPGTDFKIGYDCNNGEARSDKNCTPLRKTIDRNTGENPFQGKFFSGAGGVTETSENAFCGSIYYGLGGTFGTTEHRGVCGTDGFPSAQRSQDELYLISADGSQKTILARERIGGTQGDLIYALSLLRMKGVDTNGDGVSDKFVCADGFQCRGMQDVDGVDGVLATDCQGIASNLPGELPRSRFDELNPTDAAFVAETCDTKALGFSKDFIPISPMSINIIELKFYISPDENPHYAFAEDSSQEQPRVTIVMTVAPNTETAGGTGQSIAPLTLIETVSTRILTPIPAPLTVW